MPGRNQLGQFTKQVFDIDWILGKITPVTESGCWLWDGYCNDKNYGMYRTRDGKNNLAHRFVFNIVNGFLPKLIMHKCDNPCCVNPDHLEAGTQQQNLRDYVDRHGGNKTMFKQQVPSWIKDEIYHAEGKQVDIAKKYGVSATLVSRIKSKTDTNRTRFGG